MKREYEEVINQVSIQLFKEDIKVNDVPSSIREVSSEFLTEEMKYNENLLKRLYQAGGIKYSKLILQRDFNLSKEEVNEISEAGMVNNENFGEWASKVVELAKELADEKVAALRAKYAYVEHDIYELLDREGESYARTPYRSVPSPVEVDNAIKEAKYFFESKKRGVLRYLTEKVVRDFGLPKEMAEELVLREMNDGAWYQLGDRVKYHAKIASNKN